MTELFSHPYQPEPETTPTVSTPVDLPVFSDRSDQRERSH